mmetsp:Transcript_56446/g.101460  ORF Transcript_56446/g.101460 Transcript_56446/m.101460 type:complete len:132 (+) Transcript_56446:127-522(+)
MAFLVECGEALSLSEDEGGGKNQARSLLPPSASAADPVECDCLFAWVSFTASSTVIVLQRMIPISSRETPTKSRNQPSCRPRVVQYSTFQGSLWVFGLCCSAVRQEGPPVPSMKLLPRVTPTAPSLSSPEV